MGSRADFYVGRGKDAEWLGSIAWDGYPGARTKRAFEAKSEEEFRAEVAALASEDDFTSPEQGWPWPWETSHTTDFAYAWDDGTVWATCFAHQWTSARACGESVKRWDKVYAAEHGDDAPKLPRDAFPDMAARKRVALGKRSGLIIAGD